MVLVDMVAYLSRFRKELEKEGYDRKFIDVIITIARKSWKEAEDLDIMEEKLIE
ncbi:MAG: hypothetical protein HWN68_19585 [Desulfobacterales bacterium]|nr:hypothetical protein [Desulfobacterales bacterium]